jgi:cation diffusion facilitator CzcD-associated flavoprotein CzcO
MIHSKRQRSLSRSACDVAVVGAGPYGLAAAAHLIAADGLDVRVLGEPMSFWQRQMPAGMLLRSPWEASHISDPETAFTLDAYEAQNGGAISRPVPLERFVSYGRWFQKQLVPDVDPRLVQRIGRLARGFRLQLADGDALEARRVVVAAGIAPFAWRPPQFALLPPELASHSSEHSDLERFRGQDVLVVGAGQSAIETAALLAERGARAEVVARAPRINWLVRSSRLHRLRALRRLLYAPADIGPAGVSWIVATPNCFKCLPFGVQDPVARRSIRPAASGWLVPRTRDVPISVGRTIVSATPLGDRLDILLDDGSRRRVDHLLFATGFRVDVASYPFLGDELLQGLHVVDGYPKLDRGFQSSIPGLHVLGAPAARSFGPLTRFVAGTRFSARALTRAIVRK